MILATPVVVATPVTVPIVPVAVAMAVLLLLHVPPPASVSVVLRPVQITLAPVMADGCGFTVKVAVLPDESALAHPDGKTIELIVTVVAPVDASAEVVKLPEKNPITIVAAPLPELAPLKV